LSISGIEDTGLYEFGFLTIHRKGGFHRLFENRLKFSSFPMIEETLFWEGEAVF
jgi:hypothetical protein